MTPVNPRGQLRQVLLSRADTGARVSLNRIPKSPPVSVASEYCVQCVVFHVEFTCKPFGRDRVREVVRPRLAGHRRERLSRLLLRNRRNDAWPRSRGCGSSTAGAPDSEPRPCMPCLLAIAKRSGNPCAPFSRSNATRRVSSRTWSSPCSQPLGNAARHRLGRRWGPVAQLSLPACNSWLRVGL